MLKGSKNPHLQRARVGNCEECGTEYRAVNDYAGRKTPQRFCGKTCYWVYWRREINPRLKQTGATAEANASWKGDQAGYDAMHKWIARQKGKPMECEHCGDTTPRKYEWANKSQQYKRDITDWMRLCTPCHRRYDNKLKRQKVLA